MAHVLRDHRRVVVAAAREIVGQFLVGQRVRVNRLDRPVRGDPRRLDRRVPIVELLPASGAGLMEL